MTRRAEPKTNLAPEASRLVGRVRELEALHERTSAARLVTIVGPAGVGKTRLARRFGRDALATWARGGGAWFCALAGARSALDVAQALARVLGATLVPGPDPVRAAVELVAARGPVLLILDEVEHLTPSAADALAPLLAGAPQLRLLVTSRGPLRLDGETILELAPLSAPEATELLLLRARAVRAGWAGGSDDPARVEELVRALDGLPLALELCAGRALLLSPAEMVARLACGRLELLPGLGAALDWSWEALAPSERDALAACAVFRGGFGVAAAERILGVPSALDALETLRQRSLVHATPGADGQVRLELYESIRAYADARLAASGRRDEVLERHARHYVEWAEAQPEPTAALAEATNLLAIHARFAGDHGGEAWSIRAALALAPDPSLGLFEAYVPLLGVAVDDARRRGLDRLLVRALVQRAGARYAHGELEDARRDLDEALPRVRALADRPLEVETLRWLGIVDRERGQLGDARRSLEAALGLAREAGELGRQGLVLGHLATLCRHEGAPAKATSFYERALELHREVGNRRGEAVTLGNLGHVAAEAGDLAAAREHYLRALALLGELSDRRSEGILRLSLGRVEARLGKLGAAERELARATASFRAAGALPDEGLALAQLGALEARRNHLAEAAELLTQASARIARLPAPGAAHAVQLLAGHLDLARARAAPDAASAVPHLARATRALDGTEAAERRHAEVREAADELRRAIAAHHAPRAAGRGAVREAPVDPGRGARAALELDSTGRWFQYVGGPRVDLTKRPTLRRFVVALLEAHARTPGVALPLGRLTTLVWPAETLAPEVAAGRIYVSINALRKLGLARALVTRDDGYLLDPSLAITCTPSV